MVGPPPVPAAGTDIPPPLFNYAFIRPKDGMLTVPAIAFLTQFWAYLVGEAGIAENVAMLQAQVAIIFGMHGDGTLSGAGVLIVTKTNGVAFGYFATGTDAANLSGTLAAARIAAGSLPYSKLANAAVASLLGADAAGPIVGITIGRGLVLAAGALSQQDPVTVVGSLGAPTAGKRAFVTDSTVAAATNFGAIVAGGGGFTVPTFGDGVNWLIG